MRVAAVYQRSLKKLRGVLLEQRHRRRRERRAEMRPTTGCFDRRMRLRRGVLLNMMRVGGLVLVGAGCMRATCTCVVLCPAVCLGLVVVFVVVLVMVVIVAVMLRVCMCMCMCMCMRMRAPNRSGQRRQVAVRVVCGPVVR